MKIRSKFGRRKAEGGNILAPRFARLFRLPPSPFRLGITLMETLLAVGVMGMTIVAMAGMMHAVSISSEYSQGYGDATQHARVCLDRIARAVSEAYGCNDYCGVWIVEDSVGSYNFPDTLVVWRPSTGTPANSDGPPRANELVIFCPNPNTPNQLWELTAPSNTQTVPTPGTNSFKTFITNLKTAASSNKSVLTTLLRTASPGSGTRGAVRFVVTLNPSAAEWTAYKNNPTSSAFVNLPWAQSVFSSQTGLRQVWVRTELQMVANSNWVATGAMAAEAIPYFGSATFCYRMKP